MTDKTANTQTDSRQAAPSPEDRVRAIREKLENVRSGRWHKTLWVQSAPEDVAYLLSLVEELKGQVAEAHAGLLIHERLLLAISRSGGAAKCWQKEFQASWAIRGRVSSNVKSLVARAETAEAEAEKAKRSLRNIAQLGQEWDANLLGSIGIQRGRWQKLYRLAAATLEDVKNLGPEAPVVSRAAPADRPCEADSPTNSAALTPEPASQTTYSLTQGRNVYVDCPQFTGYGIAQYDTGDRKRCIGVLLENGNTWDYPIEAVRVANEDETGKFPPHMRPASQTTKAEVSRP